MSKTILNEVFELLHTMKVVSSESEFSKDWLGRSECYLRSLRFKGTTPSVGCVAICASKLQHYGVVMQKVDEHKRLGAAFVRLSNDCHTYINEQSKSTWLSAQ